MVIQSTRKLKPPVRGLSCTRAAPAPSESIQRKNSASKLSASASAISYRLALSSRDASSDAQTTALRDSANRTLLTALFKAMTPELHTPCVERISQGGRLRAVCT